MLIEVNGIRLFVDVVGSGLVADGPEMKERPTVFLLHGGPGFDHSSMKPDFNPLSDIAQLIYYDHRGQGRSEKGNIDTWHLNQWADDLRSLIDVLGVQNPVILGLSFGGFVAQNYAIRHPDRLHKLILASTVARMLPDRVFDAFGELGGSEVRKIAEAFWSGPNEENMAAYMSTCIPLYTRTPRDPDAQYRTIMTPEVLTHFSKPQGENWTFDFREGLKNIHCPTLITAGTIDPVTPMSGMEEMAACISDEFLTFEKFENCGHGVHRDDPRAFDVMRRFILAP